jgi:hypothetical protein
VNQYMLQHHSLIYCLLHSDFIEGLILAERLSPDPFNAHLLPDHFQGATHEDDDTTATALKHLEKVSDLALPPNPDVIASISGADLLGPNQVSRAAKLSDYSSRLAQPPQDHGYMYSHANHSSQTTVASTGMLWSLPQFYPSINVASESQDISGSDDGSSLTYNPPPSIDSGPAALWPFTIQVPV